MKIFPIDIQEYTVQSHWVKRHTTSKRIYIAILLAIIIIAICLPLIDIDLTSQSRGVIRTPNENNNIQSAIYGQITQSDIYENKFVLVGDTLFCLKIDDIEEQQRRLEQRIEENLSFIYDINRLFKGNNPITSKYIMEFSQFKSTLLEREIIREQAKKEYDVSKKLYDKGVESQFDFNKVESNYKSTQSQYNSIREQTRSTWEAEKTRLELENKDLQSNIQQLLEKKYQYFIIAPISGNIVQYTGMRIGNIVSPGQTLAQIVPQDNLIVESFITPSDIGYIKIGQKVKLQIDAFDYQQWGLLEGNVTQIISDAVQVDGVPFFRVRCSINKDYLELANGYKGYLTKGMTLTSRFYLTQRSLAQLLFDNINNWMNPKIIDSGNKN